jgi:hypothetical protein
MIEKLTTLPPLALATTLDGAIEIAISDLNANYDKKIDDSAFTATGANEKDTYTPASMENGERP